jgi:SAM-dependent methyltransferase
MKTETRLYDTIGRAYDTTRRADPRIAERLPRFLEVRGDGVYLDLGCGTGNYTVALSTAGGRWIGVDISAEMIEAARKKSSQVTWHVASAVSLRLPPAEVWGVVCVLALRHFTALSDTFMEARRVLRTGGRLVLFTASRQQIRGYWMNKYFPRAMARAIDQMPDVAEVERALRVAGFISLRTEPFVVGPGVQDFFLYSGKHFPERYLDPQFRAGISTFGTLADSDQIASGCGRLAADIRMGRWALTDTDDQCFHAW